MKEPNPDGKPISVSWVHRTTGKRYTEYFRTRARANAYIAKLEAVDGPHPEARLVMRPWKP